MIVDDIINRLKKLVNTCQTNLLEVNKTFRAGKINFDHYNRVVDIYRKDYGKALKGTLDYFKSIGMPELSEELPDFDIDEYINNLQN